MIERRHMHFSQRFRRRIATGLTILFLALALVPIYQILAKLAPGGRFVQLCSAMGIQTVWVANDAADVSLPSLSAAKGAVSADAATASSPSKGSPNLSNPFGSCEFCWASVLATVLPLALLLFFGLPELRFSIPAVQAQVFRSFLAFWHLPSRAPPLYFSI